MGHFQKKKVIQHERSKYVNRQLKLKFKVKSSEFLWDRREQKKGKA